MGGVRRVRGGGAAGPASLPAIAGHATDFNLDYQANNRNNVNTASHYEPVRLWAAVDLRDAAAFDVDDDGAIVTAKAAGRYLFLANATFLWQSAGQSAVGAAVRVLRLRNANPAFLTGLYNWNVDPSDAGQENSVAFSLVVDLRADDGIYLGTMGAGTVRTIRVAPNRGDAAWASVVRIA